MFDAAIEHVPRARMPVRVPVVLRSFRLEDGATNSRAWLPVVYSKISYAACVNSHEETRDL